LAFLPLDPAVQARQSNTMTPLDPFNKLLEFETDCWDVHEDLESRKPDYIILDVRSAGAYAVGTSPELSTCPTAERKLAVSLPASPLLQRPHCNGADKAAVRLTRLNRKGEEDAGGPSGVEVGSVRVGIDGPAPQDSN
jgi:hypothetical protein